MPQVFLARSAWATSPYLGLNVDVYDENNIQGQWTGSSYGPAAGLTTSQVEALGALVSRAGIVVTDTGTAWLSAPTMLSFSAVLDSGTATTVLLEVRDSGGTVSTAATIVVDTVGQTLRQAFLLRQQAEYRFRRSSGTGSVTITV